LSYSAKSPFARAAKPSAYAFFALASELARDVFEVTPVLPVVVVFPALVQELPPNT
jgi:hypothetical protein